MTQLWLQCQNNLSKGELGKGLQVGTEEEAEDLNDSEGKVCEWTSR